MLLKWMLALGLQGAVIVTIAPTERAFEVREPLPTLVLNEGSDGEKHRSIKESLLDAGFRSMYELDFADALQRFGQYQRNNPGDPMGAAGEAASLLFSEFNRLGVFESQMFIKDAISAACRKLLPSSAVLDHVYVAIQRAQILAEERLSADGEDWHALLAAAFVAGLQAECLTLLHNRDSAALGYARQATTYAQQLLAACPNCFDAQVVTGLANFSIGSGRVPVRWILRASVFSGDEHRGIEELLIGAQYGHYLVPFAEILLATACLRNQERRQESMQLNKFTDAFWTPKCSCGSVRFSRQQEDCKKV